MPAGAERKKVQIIDDLIEPKGWNWDYAGRGLAAGSRAAAGDCPPTPAPGNRSEGDQSACGLLDGAAGRSRQEAGADATGTRAACCVADTRLGKATPATEGDTNKPSRAASW